MTTKEYQKLALKTDLSPEQYRQATTTVLKRVRGLHAALGLATEVGELVDAFKKHIYYGRELDEVNLLEETGDLLWYIAILCDQYGFTIEQAMERNIAKLKARYGEKFSESAALQRNLEVERKELTSPIEECSRCNNPKVVTWKYQTKCSGTEHLHLCFDCLKNWFLPVTVEEMGNTTMLKIVASAHLAKKL